MYTQHEHKHTQTVKIIRLMWVSFLGDNTMHTQAVVFKLQTSLCP